jgi:ABC-2 type transport system permease protein
MTSLVRMAREVQILTGRNLRKILRVPQLAFFSMVQPILFLTLFSQVFRSIAQTPSFPKGVEYIDYLLPSIVVTTMAQNAVQSAVGIATDLNTGVIDRFRSLPISRSAVLVARSLSDFLRSGFQVIVMVALGMGVFGFRFHDGAVSAFAMMALSMLFAWGMTWIFLAIGVKTRNPETAQVLGFMMIFPLMFASSAYVPLETLPGWLRAVAKVNPLSYMVDATRAMVLGGPIAEHAWEALLAIAAVASLGALITFDAWRKLGRPQRARRRRKAAAPAA